MRPTRLLLALLALLGTACATTAKQVPASAPQSAVAEQRAFLWEVTRPGTPDKVLYLTGSIHMGQPGQFVFPPSMEAAFARSQALVVELDPSQVAPQKAQQLVMLMGLYTPPDGLSAHLSPETRALLPEALQRVGLPPEAVERMQPWLVYMTLSVLELQRIGYSEAGGIDRLLLTRARGSNKSIVELETIEGQMRMLASFSDEVQELMLRDQLQASALMAVHMARMTTAWESGNPEALSQLLFEKKDDPSYRPFYEGLFFTRNRQMADKLVALFDKPETHFVVVGAGHVVGEQGLLDLLARKGFQVRQLPREP